MSIAPTVRAVLFDAVGTLIHANPCVVEVYEAEGKRHGSRLGREEIEPRFARAFAGWSGGPFAAGSNMRPATSPEIERRQWRQVVAEVFDDVRNVEPLFESLWHHFARPESWRADDGAADCLAALRRRGLSVAVASNFDDRLPGILRGLPPLDSIEHVFYSALVGRPKPDPRFFSAVEQALGRSGHELLLVGDDVQNDFHGAQAAGWTALLLDGGDVRNRPGVIRSLLDVRIGSLRVSLT